MKATGFPKYLTRWTHEFCTDCTLSIHFNGETEVSKPFDSGRPQGSPLSPILFVIYSARTILPSTPALKVDSIYVDDDIMLQGATRPGLAANLLQTRLNQRQQRALPLGLSYSPTKSELIYLLPRVSHATYPTVTLTVNDTRVPLSKTIRRLGLTIDHKLTVREHTAKAITKAQSILPLIQRLAFSRGASMGTLRHMTRSLLIPILLWGSEI